MKHANFTNDNTIVIDDNPYKHVFNSPENVLVVDLWSYQGDEATDTFLVNVLVP